jgi:hypothetical protein
MQIGTTVFQNSHEKRELYEHTLPYAKSGYVLQTQLSCALLSLMIQWHSLFLMQILPSFWL